MRKIIFLLFTSVIFFASCILSEKDKDRTTVNGATLVDDDDFEEVDTVLLKKDSLQQMGSIAENDTLFWFTRFISSSKNKVKFPGMKVDPTAKIIMINLKLDGKDISVTLNGDPDYPEIVFYSKKDSFYISDKYFDGSIDFAARDTSTNRILANWLDDEDVLLNSKKHNIVMGMPSSLKAEQYFYDKYHFILKGIAKKYGYPYP